MTIRPVTIRPASAAAIGEAAAILGDGGLVAFPTETVYGLGADGRNEQAVASIFAAKNRPQFNPLIVHVKATDTAAVYADFDDRAHALAARYWPGPLTLVLPRHTDSALSLLVSAGLETVALRVPAHPTAQALLSTFDGPIAAPSANASGAVSPTRAEHVAQSLGGAPDLIVDGGPCPIGLESTVIDLSGDTPRILRHGAVTLEALRREFGPVDDAGTPGETAAPVKSPGMLARHYATSLPLRLEASSADPDEALLAFGEPVPPGAAKIENLSPAGDLTEAAANLFAMLRALDLPQYSAIAVVPIPDRGLGRAINDRLRRAALPP
ncbi:MAG: L-threonylcarbamoyladenylate synthase [Alphaproteobacteria bacterium]|nr:L-threonylcarbamoyladenylate synthase [Alphaproteobacteria bacterium]